MSHGRPYALITFAKRGPARYVGHLDLVRCFDRAVRRARLPVAYSEGFNPRARIAFGPPLPLGVEGEAELCALDLAEWMAPDELKRRLAAQMPAGLDVVAVRIGQRGRRSPLANLSRATYEASLVLSGVTQEEVAGAVRALLQSKSIEVASHDKGSEVRRDIRHCLLDLQCLQGEGPRLAMTLALGDGPQVKPAEVIAALSEALGRPEAIEVHRLVRKGLA